MLMRFYKPFVERLLMALIFLRDQGYDMTQPISHAARGVYGNQDNLFFQLRKLATRQGEHPDIHEMIAALGALVEGKEGEEHKDAELIDLVVDTLQLPYARNILAGQSVDSLRNAILLPNELAGLRTRLQAHEVSCSRCGREMVTGEVVTLVREGRGGNSFYCQRCAGIYIGTAYVACNKCNDHQVSLSPKVVKALRGGICGACSGKKEEEPAGPPAPERVFRPEEPERPARPRAVAGTTATGRIPVPWNTGGTGTGTGLWDTQALRDAAQAFRAIPTPDVPVVNDLMDHARRIRERLNEAVRVDDANLRRQGLDFTFTVNDGDFLADRIPTTEPALPTRAEQTDNAFGIRGDNENRGTGAGRAGRGPAEGERFVLRGGRRAGGQPDGGVEPAGGLPGVAGGPDGREPT